MSGVLWCVLSGQPGTPEHDAYGAPLRDTKKGPTGRALRREEVTVCKALPAKSTVYEGLPSLCPSFLMGGKQRLVQK